MLLNRKPREAWAHVFAKYEVLLDLGLTIKEDVCNPLRRMHIWHRLHHSLADEYEDLDFSAGAVHKLTSRVQRIL